MRANKSISVCKVNMNQFRIHPFVPAKYKKQKPRIENEEYLNIILEEKLSQFQ